MKMKCVYTANVYAFKYVFLKKDHSKRNDLIKSVINSQETFIFNNR